MIYTVTMNPSLDYMMVFKEARLGELNRSSREWHIPGGKGINVSVVLENLGVENTCLGFIAGYVGEEIERVIREKGCRTEFIHLQEGCTRINVKVREISGRESELNGSGPVIREQHVNQLRTFVGKMQEGDLLVLSGNVPGGVPADIYGQLAVAARGRGAQVVVDAERRYLFPALSYHPLLIKPNLYELREMIGREIHSRDELRAGVRILQEQGARNVLVSLGKDGAYFLGERGEEFFSEAPKGTVISSVGSGDSMVAGFLSRYVQAKDLEDCVRWSVAAGSAGAFSEALPERPKIERVAGQIKVEGYDAVRPE